MFDDFRDDKDIIVDFENMMKKAEDFKNDMDLYCRFMKDMFLGTSGLN